MFRRMLILLIGLALAACEIPGVGGAPATISPTALPPTATPKPTHTLTPVPTSTASPTPSATPTLTPFPALSGNKPYLMVKQDRDNQKLSIYGFDSGRKIIELPSDGHTKGINQKLDTIVSPDGEWLVFYTGSTHYLDGDIVLPVTLKLLNIGDGTVKKVADVVTDGYAEKLGHVDEKLKKLHPDYYKSLEENGWVSSSTISMFEWGIYSIAWSPDSRTLAFAAQIDGLSSDVYLYDLETGEIRQAEDSLLSVREIQWSPDGKKIVFENSTTGYGDIGYPELHVISPGEKAVKNPKTLSSQAWIGSFDPFTQTWSPTGDWLSPSVLLVAGTSPDAGSNGIDALNINTGQSTRLWGDIFGGYAIDQKNKIVAVSPSEYTHPENLGLYFITSNGQRTKVFDGLYYLDLFFRGGEKHRFVATGLSGNNTQVSYPMSGTVGLDLSGKPTFLADFFGAKNISISPDYAWLLIYDDQNLYLYDINDELVKTFPIPGIQRIIWRPDSQAIFYSAGKKLYTLSLPAGESKWIDDSDIWDAVWLP